MISLDSLRKKKLETPTEVLQESMEEEETQLAKVQMPQLPVVVDDNPFGDSDDETSAVDAIEKTIDPNPERLAMIANAKNPRANAVGETHHNYIKLIAGNKNAGLKELAEFNLAILHTVLKHEIGQSGKQNRTLLYLDALKARNAFEQELDLRTAGDKAFGKK